MQNRFGRSQLRLMTTKFALVLAAVIVGLVGWSGEPKLLPVSLFFPLLWAQSPDRSTACFVAMGYFLAASHGLPQGIMTFFGSGWFIGISLWIAASFSFVLIYGLAWCVGSSMRKPLRFLIASIIIAIPPFGILGWAHPITSAGILLPEWGWLGLIVVWFLLCLQASRYWKPTTILISILSLYAWFTWLPPDKPADWKAISTQFGGGKSLQTESYDYQMQLINLVKDRAEISTRYILLPETILGSWTKTKGRLWRGALSDGQVTVIASATLVRPNGYENVLLGLSGEGVDVIYRQRMPVPLAMWQPWPDQGALAFPLGGSVMEIGGTRVASFICYEAHLVWPVLHSMISKPDLLLLASNGWWASETNIMAIQSASMQAWATLFGLEMLESQNQCMSLCFDDFQEAIKLV